MRGDDLSWRCVERGLSSAGRLKILRVLASSEEGGQTRYGLERVTGLKPVDVRKHLKILIETGWVKEHDYTPPVYTLNHDEAKTQFLMEFFRKIGCI